jgi:hypothetical protein
MNVYEVRNSLEPQGSWVFLQRAQGLSTFMNPNQHAAFFAEHTRLAVERHSDCRPKGSRAKLGDMTHLGSFSYPVLSKRARAAFEPHLQGLGQWIQLDFDEQPYWLFHLQAVEDVLDLERSRIRYFSSGKVMEIERAAFRESALTGLFMWNLPQRPTHPICVTDTALDLVREHGLTGFEFELLWNSRLGALPQGLKDGEQPRFSGLETEPFDADAFWAKHAKPA